VVEGRDAWRSRDYRTARSRFEEALSRARRTGSRFGEVAALHFLGNLAFNECRDEESRRLHRAALRLSAADADDQGVATSLANLALIEVAEGDLERARTTFADAVAAYERAGMPEAAASVRATADALVVERVRLESRVHRQAPA
jgi:tetratricopeptide (TPR) repeat protein